ncbi:hypothetical protein E2562_034634 [Oryza meyeriana var. granulata]|uniref:Uncharacterized protein n=1 Tax=Oryza meyeriana var. granulata TaxID=110450 RepID=A0A6G1F1D8_9ORYZ|nr:hypothetical protein E2562_034634 [Oryza meyeriana var. granulata]
MAVAQGLEAEPARARTGKVEVVEVHHMVELDMVVGLGQDLLKLVELVVVLVKDKQEATLDLAVTGFTTATASANGGGTTDTENGGSGACNGGGSGYAGSHP